MAVIFQYTRQQAIDDGVLVDVSSLARELGFRYPVAMTRAVYDTCAHVPEVCCCQDVTGRLWDVLSVLRYEAARPGRPDPSQFLFTVLMQHDETGPQPWELKTLCGPGDNLEPVITIMLPDED